MKKTNFLKNFIITICIITPLFKCLAIYDPMHYAELKGYNGESSFVKYPAYTGSCVGYTFALLPAMTITEPTRLISVGDEYWNDRIGADTLKIFSKSFGALFGAIPYGLQKAFWDFPIFVYSGKWPVYAPTVKKEQELNPKLLNENEKKGITTQSEETTSETSYTPPVVAAEDTSRILDVTTKGSEQTQKEDKTSSTTPSDEINTQTETPTSVEQSIKTATPDDSSDDNVRPASWSSPDIDISKIGGSK